MTWLLRVAGVTSDTVVASDIVIPGIGTSMVSRVNYLNINQFSKYTNL